MMYINGSQNAHVYVANIHMFVCGQYHTTRAQPLTKPYGVHVNAQLKVLNKSKEELDWQLLNQLDEQRSSVV